MRGSQARSMIDGRDFVSPNDVKAIAAAVMGHRLIISPAARMRGLTGDDLVAEVLHSVPVPGAEVGWSGRSCPRFVARSSRRFGPNFWILRTLSRATFYLLDIQSSPGGDSALCDTTDLPVRNGNWLHAVVPAWLCSGNNAGHIICMVAYWFRTHKRPRISP